VAVVVCPKHRQAILIGYQQYRPHSLHCALLKQLTVVLLLVLVLVLVLVLAMAMVLVLVVGVLWL
jgi:hypothetical protein